MSPRRFWLLLSIAVVAMALFAARGDSPAPVAADHGTTGDHGANSCNGVDACLSNTGEIGNNSCNSLGACRGNSSNIGDNSCSEDVDACHNNGGKVGDNSCNGYRACQNNTADVLDNSCNGREACTHNDANIGNNSCNGPGACFGNMATIGDCQFNAQPIPQCPDVSVEKTNDTDGSVEQGGVFTWQVTVIVRNQPTSEYVLLTDDAPGALSVTDLIADPGIDCGPIVDSEFSCTLAEGTQVGEYRVQLSISTARSECTTYTNYAEVSGGGGTVSTLTVSDSVEVTGCAPEMTVTKSAEPTSVPETGGTVTYTVEMENTGDDATIADIVDSEFRSIVSDAANYDLEASTCDEAIDTTVAAGETASCTLAVRLEGEPADSPHTNTVTVVVESDPEDVEFESTEASVEITDVLPDVSMTKTANGETEIEVPETGETVTYEVTVTNNTAEAVTLDSLQDSELGGLIDGDPCTAPAEIAGNDTFTCSYEQAVSGEPGETLENTATAAVSDNDGNEAQASGTATVSFTDVPPEVTVIKTVDGEDEVEVPETGATVQYQVTVTNDGAEDLSIDSLDDSEEGDLLTLCGDAGALPPGETYECAYETDVQGEAGEPLENTATATVSDNDGSEVEESASATVSFTDVAPEVTVTKTVNGASEVEVPATGETVTYEVVVENNTAEPVSLNNLQDSELGDLIDGDPCAAPPEIAAHDSFACSYDQFVQGDGGTTLVNTATATVSDDDGSAAEDSADATVRFEGVPPEPVEEPELLGSLACGAEDTEVDAGAAVDLTCTLLDPTGEPLGGETLTFAIGFQPGGDASIGSLATDKVTAADGRATATLSVGSTPGPVIVYMSGAGVESRVTVYVRGEASAPAPAAPTASPRVPSAITPPNTGDAGLKAER